MKRRSVNQMAHGGPDADQMHQLQESWAMEVANDEKKQSNAIDFPSSPEVAAVVKKKKKAKKEKIDIQALPEPDNILSAPIPQLQNVVSTFSLGMKNLDLRQIAMFDKVLEFNPQCFAAATLRIKNPRTTALTFASGNVVCTGARNEHESRYAARKYCRVFQALGLKVCFKQFKIQNIVASVYVGFTIKLHELAIDYGVWANYEPDLFPGLILRSISPKLVYLIFRSGKIVITGAKTKEQIHSTYYKLFFNVILKYKDDADQNISSSAYRHKIKKRALKALSKDTSAVEVPQRPTQRQRVMYS